MFRVITRLNEGSAMKIGTVAKQAKVAIETVRYYERRGLIPPPPRTSSGYREYPVDTVNRIRFVKRAQKVGFTLSEIQKLLNLEARPLNVCTEVKAQAITRQIEVRERIDDLQRIDRSLSKLIAACNDERETEECPILQDFLKE